MTVPHNSRLPSRPAQAPVTVKNVDVARAWCSAT